VKANNMNRHMKRWHADRDSTDSEDVAMTRTVHEQSPSSGRTSRSRSPRLSRRAPNKLISLPSEEYIRNAVLCMLRRFEHINLPSLSSYLKNHFPSIPEAWRMPIVISTFAAAQKVAATHGDAVICTDDVRASLAKKSLARWTHGLSAVEPGYSANTACSNQCSRNSSSSAEDREAYSPVSNFLLNRELPVPLSSRFACTQMQREFDTQLEAETFQPDVEPCGTGNDVMLTNQAVDAPLMGSTPVNDVLMSVALASVSPSSVVMPSMPVIDSGKATLDELHNVVVEGQVVSDESFLENVPPAPTTKDQNHSSQSGLCDPVGEAVSPPSPKTFADLLCVHDVDSDLLHELSRPLSVCLTPLSSPNRAQSSSELCCEPAIQLHPSPHPSLEKTLEYPADEERLATKVPMSAETSDRPGMVRVKKDKKSERSVEKREEDVRSSIQSGGCEDVEPNDQLQSKEKVSSVRGPDVITSTNNNQSQDGRGDVQLENASQSRGGDVKPNIKSQQKKSEAGGQLGRKENAVKSLRREDFGGPSDCGKQSKENLKRSGDDGERCRGHNSSSPKQSKNPLPTAGEKSSKAELTVGANSLTRFKIPLKPNQGQRAATYHSKPNRPVTTSFASSSYRNDYSDRHHERYDADRRPLANTNHRWDPRSRLEDRNLTREQLRWLDRMPRHWC